MRKFTHILIAGCIFSGMLCASALAENTAETISIVEQNITASGECGDNAAWTLYENGELHIDGTGNMSSYSLQEVPWYSYKGIIKNVTISEGITNVGNATFEECSSLTSITIPETVTSIGISAFNDCSSLASITIPESVISIGDYAFQDCSSLTSINIPDNLSTIEEHVFDNCSGLISITISESVTSIGNYAFQDCSSLTSINIPENVTTIGNYVFWGCSSLTNIVVPDSVTDIGDGVFSGCSSLKNINLPKNISTIGDYLFNSCRSLTSITIPETVTRIGNSAFWHCSNLTSITIPETVTGIGGSAFSDCINLTDITIPQSVTNIGGYAFYSCDSLTAVTFLGDAPDIGENVFNDKYVGEFCIYYMSGKTGWTSPTWNGYPSACLDVNEFSQLDENNRNSQNIVFTLNDSSKTAVVGTNTMDNNNSGYTGANNGVVIIPDTVTKDGKTYKVIGIGQGAFSQNKILKEIQLSKNVSSISSSAFSECSNLKSFSVSSENKNYSVLDGILFDYVQFALYKYPAGKTETEYTVPNTVKSIASLAFQNAQNLETVVVPDNVTSIGQGAFESCSGIKNITLPFIGGSASDSESFYYIFDNNYYRCNIETATITNETLKGYDFYIFSGSLIKNITLPSGITKIPYESFRNCSNLENLTFGTDKIIENGKVTIPDYITYIGNEAFFGCLKLNEFVVDENNPNYSSDKWGVLFNKDKTQLIQYPSARIWPYYNIPEQTITINTHAFYNCPNLVNLYIPQTVTALGISSISNVPATTICVKQGSAADLYATSNNLNTWYIDNYTLQGIEIFSLPEKTLYAMGEEDFTGLYVTTNYGGKQLQADNYTISYNKNQSGLQTVTVTYADKTAQFDIMLYNPNTESVIKFNNVTEIPENNYAFAAFYDGNKMVDIKQVGIIDGLAQVVVPEALENYNYKLISFDKTLFN